MRKLDIKTLIFSSIIILFTHVVYGLGDPLNPQEQTDQHIYAERMDGEFAALRTEFSKWYTVKGTVMSIKENVEEQDRDLGVLVAIQNHPKNTIDKEMLQDHIKQPSFESIYSLEDPVGLLFEAFYAVCRVNQEGITEIEPDYSPEFAAGVLRVIMQRDTSPYLTSYMDQLYAPRRN